MHPKKPPFIAHLVALVYFFFNSWKLPFGLLYTHLMSPFFYLYLLVKKRGVVLTPLWFFLLPFDAIHLVQGVDLRSFLVSNAMVVSTYVTAYMFSYAINRLIDVRYVFKRLLVLNFIAALLCLPLLFTPWKEAVWYMVEFTLRVGEIPRLAMLTYEASYYSLMFAPIAMYYLLKLLMGKHQQRAIYLLLLVLVPLGLSMSVGVIASIALAFVILLLVHWPLVFYKRSFFLFTAITVATVVAVTLALLVFYPHNPLFVRIGNILTGMDSSAYSRTVYAFDVAMSVARERSIWFGAGLGQVKEITAEMAAKYYDYVNDMGIVRIPNVMAETLAIFGIAGLVLRFLLITWFFFKTRVRDNYFQTLVFLFIFIYQFTGSYVVNIVEYVAWIFAFSPVFPEFNVHAPRTNTGDDTEL